MKTYKFSILSLIETVFFLLLHKTLSFWWFILSLNLKRITPVFSFASYKWLWVPLKLNQFYIWIYEIAKHDNIINTHVIYNHLEKNQLYAYHQIPCVLTSIILLFHTELPLWKLVFATTGSLAFWKKKNSKYKYLNFF